MRSTLFQRCGLYLWAGGLFFCGCDAVMEGSSPRVPPKGEPPHYAPAILTITRPVIGEAFLTGTTIVASGVVHADAGVKQVRVSLRSEPDADAIATVACEAGGVQELPFRIPLDLPESVSGLRDKRMALRVEAEGQDGEVKVETVSVTLAQGHDFFPLELGARWTFDYSYFRRDNGSVWPMQAEGLLTWDFVEQTSEPQVGGVCVYRAQQLYKVKETFTGRYRTRQFDASNEPPWQTGSVSRSFAISDREDSLAFRQSGFGDSYEFAPFLQHHADPQVFGGQPLVRLARHYASPSDSLKEAFSFGPAYLNFEWVLTPSAGLQKLFQEGRAGGAFSHYEFRLARQN